jgi:predicted DNA-binding protein with PD1-like motif
MPLCAGMVKQDLLNELFTMVGTNTYVLSLFRGMIESKTLNFSDFHLHIFKGNKNHQSTACHQQTPLESTYSITSK